MKQRPIIFNAESIRGILAGTKTQTRRVMRRQPTGQAVTMPTAAGQLWAIWPDDDGTDHFCNCSYGVPGDRLWVRETFVIESNFGFDGEDRYAPPFKDGRPVRRVTDQEYGDYWEQCHYAATDPKPELVNTDDGRMLPWRSPIYMPRWASRLTLEITGVRVERLHDITFDDFRAEGATYRDVGLARASFTGAAYEREWLRSRWDALNAKRGYPWESNPFCWVIVFRRLEG